MADKSIEQLVAAESILPTDLFVLQQSSMAKKLPGQVLLNWLTAAADGHGGIRSIEKLSTDVLVDTYRITLADTTTFDFVVNNGRGISSIIKTGTSGLTDTYTINYNDNTSTTFNVTNGAKGDKGDNAYLWIKYASVEPTAASHSFGNLPDDWIGIYFGPQATAPSDWSAYAWYKIKGEKGDTGAPATLVSSTVSYQASESGTIVPSGTWSDSVPSVPQGKYMWTRTVHQFNTGNPVTTYSVSRMGIDGTGSVSAVAGVAPDFDGNVPLRAEDIDALSTRGGVLKGPLYVNNQVISGLGAPMSDSDAVNWGSVKNIGKVGRTTDVLLAEGWEADSTAGFVNRVYIDAVSDDKQVKVYPAWPTTLNEKIALSEETPKVKACTRTGNTLTFEAWEEPPVVDIPIVVEVIT